MEIILGLLLVVLIIAGALAYGTFAWGYVVSVLWSWFIVPVFPSMPHLSIMQAAGICLVIGAVTAKGSTTSSKEKTKEEKNASVIASLLSPWVTLLIGYLIYQFY